MRKLTSFTSSLQLHNRSLCLVLVLSTVIVTVFETALLHRKWGIFARGFLQRSHLTGLEQPLFVLLSLLLDAAIIVPLGYASYCVVARIRKLGYGQRLFLVLVVSTLPLMLANFVKFQIARYLGDTIDFHWLRHMGGGSYTAMFGFISGYLMTIAMVVLAVVVSIALVLWLLRWMPWWRDTTAIPMPDLARSILHSAVLMTVGLTIIYGVAQYVPNLLRPISRKVTGNMAMIATSRVLAIIGAAPLRPDPAHLWQPPREPGDFSAEESPAPRFVRHPDVVLFVLETYRYDNIGAMVDGKSVTPVINQLIADGAVFGKCFSPSGYTTGALRYIFCGGVTLSTSTSIIDDFNANGYQTACVSAQDDTFANLYSDTGMNRADFYRGAAEDADERTSAYSIAESLAVPWTVLTRNIKAFLTDHADSQRPLFLYVNVQDSHFPYDHRDMRRLVDDHPLARTQLTPANAPGVLRTYRNAAANTDMVVGLVLDEVAEARGRLPAFVIVGDHGESLFDPELLGHGIEMLDEQHATPLVVGGMPAECQFPMAQGEIRSMIRNALTRPEAAPSACVNPDKRVFLHVGGIDHPYAIGLASASGILSYKLVDDEISMVGNVRAGITKDDIVECWRQLVAHRREISGQGILGKHPADGAASQ